MLNRINEKQPERPRFTLQQASQVPADLDACGTLGWPWRSFEFLIVGRFKNQGDTVGRRSRAASLPGREVGRRRSQIGNQADVGVRAGRGLEPVHERADCPQDDVFEAALGVFHLKNSSLRKGFAIGTKFCEITYNAAHLYTSCRSA
jgi:hypothetical protein